jgi:hypothetical protein
LYAGTTALQSPPLVDVDVILLVGFEGGVLFALVNQSWMLLLAEFGTSVGAVMHTPLSLGE